MFSERFYNYRNASHLNTSHHSRWCLSTLCQHQIQYAFEYEQDTRSKYSNQYIIYIQLFPSGKRIFTSAYQMYEIYSIELEF